MVNHQKVSKYYEHGCSVEREPKTKSMIEFDTEYACSIKALGVKENNQIKPTTRFFSGKMLMFVKLSLKSFIYNLIETFVFPNATTREIYNKNDIEYVYIYQILTDKDSTELEFLFICNGKSTKNDRQYLDVISRNEINKKHKGLRKATDSMGIANYGRRINSVRDIERL